MVACLNYRPMLREYNKTYFCVFSLTGDVVTFENDNQVIIIMVYMWETFYLLDI